MGKGYTWFKLEITGEAVFINKPLKDYLAGLGNCIHFIVLIYRPGVAEFMITFEAMFFEPGTPANDHYHVTVVNWQDVMWSIVSVPAAYQAVVEKALPLFGLRMAQGVPAVISGGFLVTVTPTLEAMLGADYELFPVSNLPRMFTLENIVQGGGPGVTGVVMLQPAGVHLNRG